MRNAYFLSHNGLGDNITNTSAVNFLLKYYDTIYFLCRDIYQDNINLMFLNKSVILVLFDLNNEYDDCKRIISNVHTDDIFISGIHKNYFKSRITHPELLKYQKNNLYSLEYSHIYDFYNDIGLDTKIYVENFNLEGNQISLEYYNDIKNYNIVFLHTKGSNRSINLSNIIDLYKNKDDYLIVCANENVYDKDISNKYDIANKYVNIKIMYYIDIIKNSKIIHVIDSCFSCIIYPLILSKQIIPDEYKIYNI
jgi:hypothetical protein